MREISGFSKDCSGSGAVVLWLATTVAVPLIWGMVPAMLSEMLVLLLPTAKKRTGQGPVRVTFNRAQ